MLGITLAHEVRNSALIPTCIQPTGVMFMAFIFSARPTHSQELASDVHLTTHYGGVQKGDHMPLSVVSTLSQADPNLSVFTQT